MADTPDDIPALPPHLRRLARLVTVLTVTMIAGFVTLIAALVIRLNAGLVPLPDEIALPQGARAMAVTRGADWFAVVTDDDRILIFGPEGALRQTVTVERPWRTVGSGRD